MRKVIACSLAALVLSSCGLLPQSFSHLIDAPSPLPQPSLPGLDGGPPRPVATLTTSNGHRVAFVANEVAFRPKDAGELNDFLVKYGGTILRDENPGVIAGLPVQHPLPSIAWYLIRVDPRRSSLDDLPANMAAAGATGPHRFSSEDGARLTALVARERARGVGPNLVLSAQKTFRMARTFEQPDGAGGFVDAAAFGWMTDVLDLSKGQLGIGVVRAWDYLDYKLIPFGIAWTQPIVAILDSGFELDPTGAPLSGNLDYGFGRPLQWNLVGGKSAGGPTICAPFEACNVAHGQEVFGAAAAVPNNRFGSAGTGGVIVRPLLVRFDTTSFMGGQAVALAALHGASVINLSFGFSCGEGCGWLYNAWGGLQGSITFARQVGAIVVATAGNGGEQDNNQFDFPPCTLDDVLCVGAIDPTGRAENGPRTVSGFGKRVAIWAPDRVFTTPTMASATPGVPRGTLDLPMPGGTSIAAPFVAGIVGLMKALNPSLTLSQVVTILKMTALPSPDPRVVPGYVNALAAVQAVSPNAPPTIQITAPGNGASVLWNRPVDLISTASDPEQGPNVDGLVVEWKSNRDGLLCTGIACTAKRLSFGNHTITATITDPFGAPGKPAVIQLSAMSKPPEVTILSPADGAVIFTSQQIHLSGTALSPSEGFLTKGLVWAIDGKQFPSSPDVWLFAGPLGKGPHQITLTATDGAGVQASKSVMVTIEAGANVPTAKIVKPTLADSREYGAGELITFQGMGFDPDGSQLMSGFGWFSNFDGKIGAGATIQIKLSGVNCLTRIHEITLSVNSANSPQPGTDKIKVFVGKVC